MNKKSHHHHHHSDHKISNTIEKEILQFIHGTKNEDTKIEYRICFFPPLHFSQFLMSQVWNKIQNKIKNEKKSFWYRRTLRIRESRANKKNV